MFIPSISTLSPDTPPHNVFLDRILGMVKDYGINLQEAIIWDMTGFPEISMIFSEAVEDYLRLNNLSEGHARLYRSVILGDITASIPEDDEL